MIKTRSFRSLVCLLLICCFLVHCMTPRAEAFGLLTGSTVLVAAGSVIATLLIGAGIQQAYENSPAFQNLVDNIKSIWTDQGIVVNDQIEVMRVPGQSVEDTVYAVKESLIESVVDIAYESGAISVTNNSFGFAVSAGTYVPSIDNCGEDISASVDTTCFVFGSPNKSCSFVLVSDQPFTAYEKGFRYDLTGDIATRESSYYEYNGFGFYYSSVIRIGAGSFGDYCISSDFSKELLAQILTGEYEGDGPTISLTDGLTAGQIAPQGTSIATGYPSWAANSFSYGNTADKYYPIALGDTYADTVSKTQEQVWEGVSEYTTEVLSNWDAMLAILAVIKAYISTHIPNLISEKVDSVKETVISLPDTFSNWFERGISIGESILEKVLALPQTIADAVAQAIAVAFVLDEAYMRAEFDALLSDFKFLGSMVDFGRGVVDVFYGIGSKPPILYVDLDAAESEFDYGDRVVFLDLTWYERYKPYGDAIISSFLWAWFGWRLLHSLPGLINGSSGAVPHINFRKWGD